MEHIKIMFTKANFGLWDKERPHIPQRNTVATPRVLRHICVTFRAVNWRLCSHHRCQSRRIASEWACVCWGTVCHNNMFTLWGRKIYWASTETGSCPERFVIAESFLPSQIITCRKDIVSNFIYKWKGLWMLPLSTAVSLIELKSLHLWAACYNLMQRCRPVSSSAAAVEGCVKFSRAQHDTLVWEGLHCLSTLAITWNESDFFTHLCIVNWKPQPRMKQGIV